MRLGVSGRVRPNSGIGVIQRMLYPHLAERFELVESPTRDTGASGALAAVTGVLRGLAPVRNELGAYFCLVSPIPVRTPGRLVAVVHDLRWLRQATTAKKRYRAWDLARLMRRADAVVCVSATTRDELLAHHPRDAAKVHVALLGPGIVPDGTPFTPGTPGRALLIGAAAHKNNELAAEVIAAVPEKVTSVVGVNISAEAAARLRRAFGDDFEELGRVDDEELLHLYGQAAYYVHLGTDEGFGLPYVEALRCGAQVVAMDMPLTREVMGDGAILLRGQDVSTLAASWRAHRDVSDDRRRAAAQRYSWSTFAQIVADLCDPQTARERTPV